MRLLLYRRVSTLDQGDSGLGLEAQEARCRAYCAAMGHEVALDIVDVASGKSLDRPGLMSAVQQIRAGEADGLLVAKLDRLTRRVQDLFDLVEDHGDSARPWIGVFGRGGASLLSVADQLDTQTAMGRFFLTILGGIAQWERETIGERTRDALAARKTQGKRVSGRAPLGWRFDGDVVVPDTVMRVQVDHAVSAGHGLDDTAAYLGLSRSAAHRALVARRAGWPR